MADENSATVLQDGQLAVATVAQTGEIVSNPSEIDTTAVVQTESGKQLCVKTVSLGGGGGGGGTVDQTYDPTSTNAQSGTAVAEAVAPALKNTATGTDSLTVAGTDTTANYATNIGKNSSASGGGAAYKGATAIGEHATVAGGTAIGSGTYAINGVAIGCGRSNSNLVTASASGAIAIGLINSDSARVQATSAQAIQLGMGTNSNSKTFQVYEYQLLDGNTGLIPLARLGTGFDATKTQVLKHINGVATWVDEN